MKSVKVPYIAGLEKMATAELLDVMETQASREHIGTVNWPDQFPYKPIAVFDIARSDRHIFISYFVRGLDLKALFGRSNEPVWQDSCVEFFVKDESSAYYHNFEFNCIGTCLASKKEAGETTHLTSAEIGKIIRHGSLEHHTFGEKEGIFEWGLVVGIPFELFGVDADNLPPRLWANFYKCGDETSHPHYLSWNAIDFPKPNFHLPEFFGELILG